MGKHWKKITPVLIIIIACLAMIVIEVQTKIILRAYDDFVLDSKNHYLPCEELLAEEQASRIVEQHQDAIRAIEQVNPGFVGVEVDASSCPGRADLLIWYASHQDRLAIQRLIGNETFFGIPYRLQNR